MTQLTIYSEDKRFLSELIDYLNAAYCETDDPIFCLSDDRGEVSTRQSKQELDILFERK